MIQGTCKKMIFTLLLAGLSASPAFARFTAVACNISETQGQESAEGKQYVASVYGQQPVLPDSDPVTKYIQQLGAKLVAVAPMTPGMTTQWPFTFHVVASEEINAFALPGGGVFINLGTIQAAENETQLAGVMAHEISHVIMRHGTCNLHKQDNRKKTFGVMSAGARLGLGDSARNNAAQKGLAIGENLDFLHMSRGDEQQADLLGIGILYDAGYDPNGLPQFFAIIQAKYGAGGHQFLSDHPNPGNRQEYTRTEIATLPPAKGTPVVTTAAFTKAHTVAMGEKALSSADVKAGAWRSNGLYAASPSH